MSLSSKTFTLSFGKVPLNYINRYKDLDMIKEDFLSENPSNHTYIITGIRGAGKTTMLTDITIELSKLDDFIVVDLNSEKDLLEGLAAELYENAKVKKIFLKKELSVSFKGISFSIEGITPVSTPEALIKKMLDKIKSKNKKVLITIDEATNNNFMKVFSHTYQSLVRLEYPVFLLMTGLYENISKLQDEESLTFLYRAPKMYLSSLNISRIANSYKNIFGISEDISLELAEMTKGYAYAYQVLGHILESKGVVDINPDVIDEYDYYLQEYVYDKLWFELSDVEKKIISEIKTEKVVSIKTIVTKTGYTNSYISNYRDRLIKKGIIFSSSYGKIQLTLPRFANFVRIKNLF